RDLGDPPGRRPQPEPPGSADLARAGRPHRGMAARLRRHHGGRRSRRVRLRLRRGGARVRGDRPGALARAAGRAGPVPRGVLLQSDRGARADRARLIYHRAIMGESTIRVTASRAAELTGILRKRRSEPTTIALEPGEYAIELAALIGPVTVVGEAGAARTLVRAQIGRA